MSVFLTASIFAMEECSVSVKQSANSSKSLARWQSTGEVQDERERLLRAILLALGAAGFGLLTGITLTAAIVVLLWAHSPAAVLLILTALYAITGGFLYRRLVGLLHAWQTHSTSGEQIYKDRICLEQILA